MNDARSLVLQNIINARAVTEASCPIPFSVYAGEEDWVVSAASARSSFPDAAALPGNHFTVLSSERTFSTLKQLLRSAADSEPPQTTAVSAGLTTRGTAATAEQSKLAAAAEQGRAAVADADVKKAARVLDALPPQAGWLRVVRNPEILPIHYDKVTVKFDAACIELRTERETTADFLDQGLHTAFSAMTEALDALESFMDGSMFGPDDHRPWRDLTEHPPSRQRDLPLLAEARLHFSERYQAMMNLLNASGLLPAEASKATDQGGQR
ncbi:hypothetical protein ACPXCP_12560 [Streptomyces sp. DT20]|uniref:hypothetical protein n=1 Tax=Streptomyces sp. DT20 TaxID=3416519 RepID=UPI003CE961B0